MSGQGATERPNTIVHIGCGRCQELEGYLASGAERIVLVEANPETVNELRRRTAGERRIEVIEAAVAGAAGEKTLRVFNLPTANSLRAPEGLRKIFPNLEQVKEHPVTAISAHKFFKDLKISDAETNWCVIDAPGEEYAILCGLFDVDGLPMFDRLIVHTFRAPVFEGAKGAEHVLALLSKRSYKAEIDRADPERPVCTATLDPLFKEVRALKAENAKLQEQCYRLETAQRELQRAEAQLEFMKDIFIREPLDLR